MQQSGCLLLLVAGLLLVTAPNALAARHLLQPTTTVVLAPSGAPCSNLQSPVQPVTNGEVFATELNATNNVAPNTTGVPAPPLPAPLNLARGTYELAIDATAQRASWKLTLCDVPQYIASHLHIGSPAADYPPPLIPLEPYGKPSDPFAPPALLPELCPALNITGCSYTKEGSFLATDIAPLPGRVAAGDLAVPAVANWEQFVQALRNGNIYVNVHSLAQPAGLIRGNLRLTNAGAAAATPPTATTGTAPVAEAPVAEAPVARAPAAETPAVEAPVAEAPTPETLAVVPGLVVVPVVATPAAETRVAAPTAEPAAETGPTGAPRTSSTGATGATGGAGGGNAVIDGLIGDATTAGNATGTSTTTGASP